MYLSLSWRNIWRNKRRTIIVAASVFFAVFFASLMRSAQVGSYGYMIHSSAKLYTGYLQVQGEGYWDNRSLDKSIIIGKTQQNEISNIPNLISINPRIEAFALVSHKTSTKVAQVIGIDPQSEDNMTGLKDKLINGAYLTGNSEGLLVAEGLAQMLKISVGDSIILYGQGYHGQIAAARLPVAGLVKLPFEEMNNGLVYMTLSNAQNVFSSYDRITSLSIMIDNIKHLDAVLSAVRAVVGQEFAIMTWDKMMPDLVQSIQMDNAGGIIMLAILYIIIGFGVFGTVMMMISERAKEFGILISVGMKKWKLILVAAFETIFVSFLGVITGIIGSLPLIFYLYHNPISITGDAAKTFDSLGIEAVFTFSADPGVFINQAAIVFIIALATIVYPFLFIRKLEPVNVLRG